MVVCFRGVLVVRWTVTARVWDSNLDQVKSQYVIH